MERHINIITTIPSTQGGSFKRHLELLEGFLEKGWNVYLFSDRYFGNEIKHFHLKYYKSFHYKSFPFPPHPLYAFLYYPKLFFSILGVCYNKKGNDIYIAYCFNLVHGVIFCLVKSLIHKLKVVIAFRGDSVKGYTLLFKRVNFLKKIQYGFYTKLLPFLEKFVVRVSDIVIFNSESNKEAILKRAALKNSTNILVIYNNVNPSWMKTENIEDKAEDVMQLRIKNLKKSGWIVLGFVGNLYIEKGLLCLIRAFKLIKKGLPNSLLVILGTGPDEGWLREVIKKLKIQSDVIMAGWIENPVPYYKLFDLLIFPSINEGFANVILEALYMNVPVIASNHGPNVEALKYDELLFPEEDFVELANRVTGIFKDVKRYKLVKSLCKERRTIFEFNWREKMIEPLMAFVKEKP